MYVQALGRYMTVPVFVYDDDCGFCTWWARFFEDNADVTLVGFSELDETPAIRERLPEEYETCSHLVTDEAVYSCGKSIEETLLRTDPGPLVRPFVERLRQFGRYETVREGGYKQVAHSRDIWGRWLSETPPASERDER